MPTIRFNDGAVHDGTNYTTPHPSGAAGVKRPVGASGVEKLPKIAFGTFDFDSSYATGGETIAPIWDVLTPSVIIFEAKNGFLFEADLANKKVKAYRFDYPAASQGPAVEVPAATNMSTVTGVLWFAVGV